jgi:hypothetical protein
MTTPDAAASGTPDFTIKREPITFTIDDDTFSAPALTSPITLKKLAGVAGKLGDLGALSDLDGVAAAIDALGGIMAALMPGASGELFKARLASEGGDGQPPPIDLLLQGLPAFYYLMERKGLRPTTPSSDSSGGPTDGQTNTPSDGTSSTAGASPTDSGQPSALATVDLISPTGLI